MAYFDEAILPGEEGKIKVRLNTRGFRGPIEKIFKVYTNDPLNKIYILRVSAYVRVPISISSRYVTINGKEGYNLTRRVEINAELDRPLKLTPIQFSLENSLSYKIEEIEAGRKFYIHFVREAGPPEFSKGFLRLRTNYPEKKEITLKIRINVVKEEIK